MRCGTHRWSVSGPFLTIEHEVRPIEGWLYRGALLLSLAFPVIAFTTGFFAGEVRVWILMVALGGLAVHHLTSRWKVLLNLETRSVWRRTGYREALGAKTEPLETFTAVALYQRDKGSTEGLFIAKVYVVALLGTSETVVLSHSDDREEAVELAQAVSKFLGLGLSVEGGQSRSVTARLEEAPLSGERLPDLPHGSGIQFRQDARGLTLELPPCGWRPAYAAQGAFAVLVAVGGPLFLLRQLRQTLGQQAASSQVMVIASSLFIACGAFFWWWVAREATSRWSINASSRGIEATRYGPWRARKVLRLPRSRIEDIDVRDARTHVSRGRGIVIEHDKGSELLGMDLSQEELEWAGTVLRRALATRTSPAAPSSHARS
ncbi:hypothetical protein COCOR_03698 [Corallococcus coralloides DSM 2259]|uniref:PH domain-containing protein n=1 Tax=Corallococcus coralloides (strain ATCC 25202 / DSM 2259 / NBRC 100086 / M2) TaxID=1144275 RepID=H8MPN5_CORCM|nr:hypothetical protein [Corallococcus coralloides]AFE05394.1 hypothetical protein COCOR_03698 [Corallococcus coralloides DSM 2259]